MTTRPGAPRWSEMIALFGGRFDPPHQGHFEAVQGLFRVPGVKEVWVIPSPTPPHKAATVSFEHRLEMARLGFPGVKLDLREAERAKAQPGLPTYSFDTIQEIRRETPNIAFVIGTDQLEQFHTWHRFPEILGLCHWIILGRKPHGMDKGQAVISEWEASGVLKRNPTFLTLVPTEAADLSSTRIREEISRTGEPPEGALRPAVMAYLKQNRLYGTKGSPERK